MHSTAWSMISSLQQFQSSMQKIRLNSSQCLLAREKTFLTQSWLGFYNSCFFNFMYILFAEFVKKFLFIPVVQYLCFIVCVHRFFHSWQVFLILFKPIGTMAHYSVYVLSCWIDIVGALTSLIHFLTLIRECHEQVSTETAKISWVFLSLNLLSYLLVWREVYYAFCWINMFLSLLW